MRALTIDEMNAVAGGDIVVTGRRRYIDDARRLAEAWAAQAAMELWNNMQEAFPKPPAFMDGEPYDPSEGAYAVADKTTSHTVSQAELEANAKAAAAAALAAGANSDPMSPFAGETTTAEKMYNWMVTHPGWMNQPVENRPTPSDFSPGGLLSENYGAGAPYSVVRP